MWSVVEKTALAEAEIEYHDRTSDTVWVRFLILDGPLAGTSAVIWTTTPWTIPGNRALAAGAAIEYAQIQVDAVADGSLARVGETLLVAHALVDQVCAATGITAREVLQVVPGVELAGTLCAHPLRGQGYDFDVPILLGEFVTTEQGSGLVHQAPAHGEEDFALCRGARHRGAGNGRRGRAVCRLGAAVRRPARVQGRQAGVGRAGGGGWAARARHLVPLLPAFLALEGAADLPRHAAMVHPHGRPRPHPRPRAGRHRPHRVRAAAGPQPHPQHGRRPPRLVHQPPARLGRADPGVRRPCHR